MRWAVGLILLFSPLVWSGQSIADLSVDRYFARQEIVLDKYLAQNEGGDEDLPLAGDIYSFDAKSTKKAFFYSLVVPGAGEYYVGSRIKPAVFLGLEALIWTGYFVYHGKGNDKKDEYIQFADAHYQWWEFKSWWNSLDSTTRNNYSHELPWDDDNNRPNFTHEYYENVGKYDEFQVGWDDIGTGQPPPPLPGGVSVLSANRNHYLDLRRQSNDYFQNASTMIMLSIGNHLISAFDAALTAKSYNKGQKRFSFQFKAKKIDRTQVPILTFDYRF